MGADGMVGADGMMGADGMVGADSMVESLVRMTCVPADVQVHHVCPTACMQSFDCGLRLMVQGWQAVQEAGWEGRDLSQLRELQRCMAQQLGEHSCQLQL